MLKRPMRYRKHLGHPYRREAALAEDRFTPICFNSREC